jgi:VWFA-related protein
MLVALAPTALPCARASAQEPPAPVTILPVGTERVQVAAVVTDRQGRPVTDLKPEDFLLLEDGKPQIITHFVGAVSSPTVRSEPGSPPEAPRPAAPSAAVPPPGRHILLAIDDLHLAQQSLIQAKEALRRFVAEQMAEDDEVAVVTTSSAAGLVQPFTRNTWALRRVIDHVGYEGFPGSAGRTSMTEFQAESIARGDPEALGLAMTELTEQEMLTAPSAAGAVVNPRHRPEAESQARSVLAQALSASSRTVGTLDRMLRGLAGVPGRKVAVLVSDGFLLGTGTGPEAIDLRRIFDASARSGVAVYCLDSRGLVAGIAGGDASAAAQATMTSKPGVRESYDRLADLALRTGLGTLAAGTGGVFVHGTNDLAGGLDRILRDADASYLLGYEPTATGRDGRFRNIEVKLPGRSGLTVRARKGYFAPDDRLDRNAPRGSAAAQTTRRLEEIRGALASLVPLRDLPVRISADFLDAAPRGTQLVLSAHVDLSGIRFERASERDRADIEVLGVVYDEKGDVVGEFEPEHERLDLDPASSEQARKQGLRFRRSAALPPAVYQVRVVAREATYAQLGTAYEWVEIPQLRGGPLKLSSLFLFSGPPAVETDGASAPAGNDPSSAPAGLREVQALRRFDRAESLYYEVYAYGPSRDATGATDVVLQSQVWSGGELQGVSPLQPVSFPSQPGEPATLSGSIALHDLAPGSYELRILVVDRKGNTSSLRRSGFSVE